MIAATFPSAIRTWPLSGGSATVSDAYPPTRMRSGLEAGAAGSCARNVPAPSSDAKAIATTGTRVQCAMRGTMYEPVRADQRCERC